MTESNSRNAPKFVIRFEDKSMRTLVSTQANKRFISMNSFILQAIENELGRGARIDALLEIVETKISTL